MTNLVTGGENGLGMQRASFTALERYTPNAKTLTSPLAKRAFPSQKAAGKKMRKKEWVPSKEV